MNEPVLQTLKPLEEIEQEEDDEEEEILKEEPESNEPLSPISKSGLLFVFIFKADPQCLLFCLYITLRSSEIRGLLST